MRWVTSRGKLRTYRIFITLPTGRAPTRDELAVMASPTEAPPALTGAASCTGKRPATDSAESETTTRQRLSTEVPAESAPPAAAAPADSTANPPTSSTGASSSDELIAAAPKLIAAIRVAGKCVKVAEKVASLLEEGRVKPSNAGAVFEILTAAVEDPTRWRKPAMRAAFRRLFCAADARLVLFAMPQQQVMPGCTWESR